MTASFVRATHDFLIQRGHSVEITSVDRDFDYEEEAEKIFKVDSLIVQFPAWWMNLPWQFKRYEDEVFLDHRLNGADGRSRHNQTKLYGTGASALLKLIY